MNVARRALVVAASAALAAGLAVGPASAAPVLGPDMSCVSPAGDPQPNTPEWVQRDTLNQYCAGLRIRDQLASPAFGFGNASEGTPLYVQQTMEQLADPTHPRGGVTTR